MTVIDCGRQGYIRDKHSNQASALWNNNTDAIACLNPSPNGFQFGIYAYAVPLTMETSVPNKYIYSLFWGFQVCISFFSLFVPCVVIMYI